MRNHFDMERAQKDMKQNLSEKRYKHSYAVAETARKLAELHGEDPDRAYIAGLFHDFAKHLKQEESAAYLHEMQVEDPFLLGDANLAHGEIAAHILSKDYGLDDAGILSAIAKHTFGDVKMSRLDKIVYLADAIEPNRHYEEVEKLRKTARRDLNEACFEYLKNNFKHLLSENKRIYTKSVEMYNRILEGGTDGF